jgi:hypothetical protein
MSPKNADAAEQSFAEWAAERHETYRDVAVYVEGDLTHDPPLGNAAATRVAHLLTDEGEEVLEIDAETAADKDVPDAVTTVQITIPPNPDEDEWRPVFERLVSRVPDRADFVVLVDADDVPYFCTEWCDARVVATGIDDPLRFYRIRRNPYSGELYQTPFAGLHTDE